MLTDTTIRNAKPKEKPFKLTDERGLFLFVTPAGSRLWRCKYRVEGKEQLASFGAYPDVSLRLAREKRDELRRKIAEGKDPRAVELTFERLAREYISKHASIRSPQYEDYSLRRLKDVFSELGSKPVEAIDAPMLLKVLRKIESRGAPSMAVRVRSLCSQIFLYGVSTGCCTRNIAADLKGALAPYVEGHHAAVPANELPELLQKIDTYDGESVTKLGLMLMAHTALRTTELIAAQWSEIDVENALWTVPAQRMKMKREHLVPLSKQSLHILAKLRELNGDKDFVFASFRFPNKHISTNTLIFALYRLGYHSKMTGHGFRSVMSTILNEERELGNHKFSAEIIERQLAHVEQNAIRGAYNRAEYLPSRREMMQWWSNYLDKACTTVEMAGQ